ncbi:MAG: ABC transporter permease, partial [Chloroflexota bacterium]
MISDVWTVLWKEYKEILGRGDNMRGGRIGMLIVLGVFGVFLPWQFGKAWLESPILLVYWAWVPLMLVTTTVADSFAGERERHTLETLLASRLPDRAILFGKVAGAVLYGWGLTTIALLLGLVTVNVAHSGGELLLYPAGTALAMITLSLFSAGLAATAGVLVSLRASTVRQAQQILSIPAMLLVLVPVFGLQALPEELRSGLVQWVTTANPTTMVSVIVVILALLDAVLLAAAMMRFRRARL